MKQRTRRGAPTGHKLFNFISTSLQPRRWAHIKRSPQMITTTAFLVGFGALNLLVALLHKPLSGMVVAFFKLSQVLSPPQRMRERAKALGFDGAFSTGQLSPDRPKAARFLLWTGVVNCLGCVALYFLIPAMGGGSSSKPAGSPTQQNHGEQATPSDGDKPSN